jgi:hypothetical protein
MTFEAYFAGAAEAATRKAQIEPGSKLTADCQVQFMKHNVEGAPPGNKKINPETFNDWVTYTSGSFEIVFVGRPFGVFEIKATAPQFAGTTLTDATFGKTPTPTIAIAVHDGISFAEPPINPGAQIQYQGKIFPYDVDSMKNLDPDPSSGACQFTLGSDCTVTLGPPG